MSIYRARKAGLARDTQNKIDGQFDVDEAKKCLFWIGEMTGENVEIQETDDKEKMMDSFFTSLRDGILLCRLIDTLLPQGSKIDFSKKSFQLTNNMAFATARERERIGIFLQKAQDYGIMNANIFQTDYLYERTNLVHVCTCIRALGIEAQSHPDYSGPMIWPKKNEVNIRHFTEDQMKAGQQIISLQYGTNKCASQTGMSFGKNRHILD